MIKRKARRDLGLPTRDAAFDVSGENATARPRGRLQLKKQIQVGKVLDVELRPNIRTVARLAKVSTSTVSRVFNRLSTVDRKVSKRVWEVIQRVGYIPNSHSRWLSSGRSRLLGVIISDLINSFFPEFIRGFENAASQAGYESLIGFTYDNELVKEVCIRRMLARRVDGVAVMTLGVELPIVERLAARQVPMVFVDFAPPGELSSAIRIDYSAGIDQTVQHLAALGHRKIAFISGPPSLHSARVREKAFKASLASIGVRLPENYIFIGDHSFEKGLAGTRTLLKLRDRPTALMCSNDVTAIGAMHAIAAAGLRIPEDISLIGFDDVNFAKHLLPPLTTVRMPCESIAQEAVKILLKLAENRKDAVTIPTISTSLVVRQTTSFPVGSILGLPNWNKQPEEAI